MRTRIPRQREADPPFTIEAYREAARLPRIYLGRGDLDDVYMEFATEATELIGDRCEDDFETVAYHPKRQNFTGWIFSDEELVGGVRITRYELGLATDNDEILHWLDQDSQSEAEFSGSICDQWEDVVGDVGMYGDIILLDRMWTANRPELAGLAIAGARKLIASVCPVFAAIVLKAFPLEYEGCGNPPELELAQTKRQKALMRLYSRKLDMRPMQGQRGEEGWMFYSRPDLNLHSD